VRKSDIFTELEKKGKKLENLTNKVMKNPNWISAVLDGIYSPKANVKFGSAKMLRTISEKNPKALYLKMHFFIDLLDIDNNIIKWNAIDIIANLTNVDSKRKFDKVFVKYFNLLSDEVMVTAAHVVDNSGKIAKAKPYMTRRITTRLLKIARKPRNRECKNILLGKTILAFDLYFDQIKNKDDVISFVRRQLKNSRGATRKRAEKFLERNWP